MKWIINTARIKDEKMCCGQFSNNCKDCPLTPKVEEETQEELWKDLTLIVQTNHWISENLLNYMKENYSITRKK